ncbi:M23 family metallopeptidase [Pseudarthrobacter sp. LT1]|uniref:M23 family metallopeptidase n=1 Tax=Pseudarthrobacter sp. LT1 TaxID=3111450 RepID=UPI002D771B6E|nr:M23 family metallopeptidase [Pseudarthrobacter sp. LT1]WRT14647.1 M23 family metallopeptidase [Pseudarthrobacter sp. LT1]
MTRPVDEKFPISQLFAGLATAGVVGRPDGTEVEYLVWLYGDYQHYGHAGVDIACPVGTPIRAMRSGTVVYAGWGEDLPGDDSWSTSGYFRRWGMYKTFPGIVTVIKADGTDEFDIYGHQSSNDEVSVGMHVAEAQVIGKSGDTKTRTEKVGPHLHVVTVADPVNYSTDWPRIIFGCIDPTPLFGAQGIVLQGAITNAAATQAQEEDDEMLTIFRDTASATPDQTWIGNALLKTKVRDPQHLADLQLMAREGKMSIFKGGEVQILPEGLFGVDVERLTAEASAQATVNQPFIYREPRTNEVKGTTTIAAALGSSDLQFVATRDEVEK